MANVIGVFTRLAKAVPVLRMNPREVRDPKAVARDIGKLLEAERQRGGTDWASNLRRARAYYRRRAA